MRDIKVVKIPQIEEVPLHIELPEENTIVVSVPDDKWVEVLLEKCKQDSYLDLIKNLLVKFNTDPKKYEKKDFLLLLRTIASSNFNIKDYFDKVSDEYKELLDKKIDEISTFSISDSDIQNILKDIKKDPVENEFLDYQGLLLFYTELKTYIDSNDTALHDTLTLNVSSSITNAITDLKSYSDLISKSALNDSKAYTDSKCNLMLENLESEITEVKDNATDYIDGRYNDLEASTKQYTDNQITVVNDKFNEELTNLTTYVNDTANGINTNTTLYTDLQINLLKTNLTKYTDDQITSLNTSLTGKIEGVTTDLNTAKTNLSSLIDTKTSNAKTESNKYTDTQIESLKTNLTGYTDNKVSDLSTSITNEIDAVKTDLNTAKTDLSSLIDSKTKAVSDSIPTVISDSSSLASLTKNGTMSSSDKTKLDKLEFDSSNKISSSILPSYVDDVLDYDSKSVFPSTGETGKIYISKNDNLAYRWSGSEYIKISNPFGLVQTISATDSSNAVSSKAVADAIANINKTYLPLAGGTMTGDILVKSNKTEDLGSASSRWRTTYTGTVNADVKVEIGSSVILYNSNTGCLEIIS